MKLKKGDQVQVLSGKDRGTKGTITRVFPETNKVIVEGVNVVKKHQKATQANQTGGIIEKAMPIAASNVAIIDSDGKPTRIGYRINEDGTKVRVSKRTDSEL